MAVLSIHWESIDRVSPKTAVVTGSEAADAEKTEPVHLDKAMVVYIVEQGDAAAIKIDKIALDGDKVRVGSNFFRCVKISPTKAQEDGVIAEFADKAPCFVFVSTSLDVVEKLHGKKISGSKIFKAMEKTAKKSYDKLNLGKNVKSMLKVLNELDKIAGERGVLDEKEARGPNPGEMKKIAKERKELDERQEEALESKKDLLDIKLKIA